MAGDRVLLVTVLVLLGLGRAKAFFSSKKKSSLYKVTVKVSDTKNAGTDANVYVRLFGTKTTDACRHELDKKWHNDFERGSVETYTLHSCHDDLGDLTKVEIGFTRFLVSVNRDLELDWVQVEDALRQRFYRLYCFTDSGEKTTCRLSGKQDSHTFTIERGCGSLDKVDNHSIKCLRKLWLEAGCKLTGTLEPGYLAALDVSHVQLAYWRRHTVAEVSTDMSNFHHKAVGAYRNNKRDWRKYFTHCFGNIQGCVSWDTYGPHSAECTSNLWRFVGCVTPEKQLADMWDKVTVMEVLRIMDVYARSDNSKC